MLPIIGISARAPLPSLRPGRGCRWFPGFLRPGGDDAGIDELLNFPLRELRDLMQDLDIMLTQGGDKRQGFGNVRNVERSPGIDPRPDTGGVLIGENLKISARMQMRVDGEVAGREHGASRDTMALQQLGQGQVVMRRGPRLDL